jgi:hypothetical protein
MPLPDETQILPRARGAFSFSRRRGCGRNFERSREQLNSYRNRNSFLILDNGETIEWRSQR